MHSEGAPRIRREARLPEGGSPSGIGAAAAALEPALLEAAGPGAACVSVSLEFGAPARGGSLAVEAWVERATRTLVFAAAEARADGAVVAAASAVFRRA